MLNFKLDPRWEQSNEGQSHPRSPQAIYLDGVLVGHRREPDRDFPERVQPIPGADDALVSALQEWFEAYQDEQKRLLRERQDAFLSEVQGRKKQRAAAANAAFAAAQRQRG